jgi:hypothetical protein
MSDRVEPVSVSDAIDTSNVVGIKEKQRGRPKKSNDGQGGTPKASKLTAGQVETDLVAILEQRPITSLTPYPLNQVPPFPHSFQVFRESLLDDPFYVAIKDNTVFPTKYENISANLAEFCGTLEGVCGSYNVGLARCKKAVERWAYKDRHLAEFPPPWGFKSDPKLCFNRLDYEPIEIDLMDLEHYAPTFAEMSSRMENREAFWQRLGSLFYNDASRKQGVWLYGERDSGKSRLIVLLKILMGESVAGFNNKDFKDAFWLSELKSKRVMYVMEAEPDFINTDIYKSITGDDFQRLRSLYKQGVQVKINPMVFCFSNKAPEIPNDDSLINRVIPVKMTAVPLERRLGEEVVKEKLTREVPYIAGFCMRYYREKCPGKGPIQFDTQIHLQPAIDEYERDFFDILDGKLILDTVPTEDGTKKQESWLSVTELNEMLVILGLKTSAERRKFRTFLLQRCPNVREDRENRVIKGSTSRARGFTGIRKRRTYP